jgi:signal transduction histidine kinase/CheY-like chemotaxis protein/HPt (histidine-containing phosphotransfer) domain-containing protein
MSLKKPSLQVKIGLLMTLAVLLLSATGYLSYRSLSSIVSSIRVETRPDLRLITIREISMDLEKAENSVRIYSVTRDEHDLAPYYTVLSNIDKKVDALRTECINDSLLLRQVDIVTGLIEVNIRIWNQLLYLSHDDSVNHYLKQFSAQLDSISFSDQESEKGILRRVFNRSKKSTLDEQKLIDDLSRLDQQDSITNEKKMKQEAHLAVTSRKIKEQFNDLTASMEDEVTRHMKSKADAADQLAGKTYRWLAMFSLLGTLLVILVLYILVRYIRKTRASQIALEHSKNEAEKLARTKEMFMANMSHEIRTPVTAISGFTEQLLHETLDENTSRLLKIIKSSSDHLARIIDDILDFSKLQNGKVVLEKVHFSIRQVLEDVYTLFEKQAQQNHNHLYYTLGSDVPPVLLGDPYRLRQIMINLVGNSLKFTKEGDVHFAVTCHKKGLSKVNLIMEFADTGIGIDETKLNTIFEDFTQAEMSTTRKYGGTGLGLSIVKKLVELHNGSIDCKSQKNKGTSITCLVPFLIGDEEQLKRDVEPPLAIPDETKKLKILIVDDEEYNRLLFKTILDRWKIKYHEALNGLEALEKVKSESYDLLFMDVRMPGIDGLKATKFIRDELHIKGSVMPVVGISAACTNEDRKKYEEAGMNAFLPKPFTEAMLLTTILAVTRQDIAPPIAESNAVLTDTSSTITGKIDLKNLYHISGGDEKFVKQMLGTFIETTETGLNAMQRAAVSGQWESVAAIAHKLSPPCRHIGAVDLYHNLRDIEENIRNQIDTGSVKTLTEESLKEFKNIRVLLAECMAKIN